MAEVVIAGKKVILKERVGGKDGWNALRIISRHFKKGTDPIANMEFEDAVAICKSMIESWEFEGDPSAIESYQALDTITEFFPLIAAVIQEMNKHIETSQQKN